jgi:hypothetical protein
MFQIQKLFLGRLQLWKWLVSVALLNFVANTQHQQQQQGNIFCVTIYFSQARSYLASTSSNELVFFAGGYITGQASNRVDIYNVTNGSWK